MCSAPCSTQHSPTPQMTPLLIALLSLGFRRKQSPKRSTQICHIVTPNHASRWETNLSTTRTFFTRTSVWGTHFPPKGVPLHRTSQEGSLKTVNLQWIFSLHAHQGGHAATRFLEGCLEGSLQEVLLRRVRRRNLVRASVGTGVLILRRRGCQRRHVEGARKAETRPFAEYNSLCVHPS